MAHDHLYEARLVWTGAVDGPTGSYDAYSREYQVMVAGKEPITGSADPLFRGDGTLHNPEDLLLAAVTGCHMLSYLALAARRGLLVVGYEDEAQATLTIDKSQGTGTITSARLRPLVTVAEGTDHEAARALHATAHEQCFIARSVRFPIMVEPTIQPA